MANHAKDHDMAIQNSKERVENGSHYLVRMAGPRRLTGIPTGKWPLQKHNEGNV